ncbi:hypothetical protein SAMN04488134_101204 [Amphibacillus marinus]|uniref:Uncharacterized protein n=2 Tax=Amphibacillus marinus TaxID=872970 RepID=A0A1H8GYJ6_9BACI|nr:hypothetical protein SAMN04488134_101204 [Amphibacillus marinus]
MVDLTNFFGKGPVNDNEFDYKYKVFSVIKFTTVSQELGH